MATASGKVEKGELSWLLQEELNEMDSAASMVFEDSGLAQQRLSTTRPGGNTASSSPTCSQRGATSIPDLVRKYFMTEAVKPGHNKFTALARGVVGHGRLCLCAGQCPRHAALQVILNQASDGVGGYHHTLVVTEQGAEVTVVDDLLGAKDGLQASVVELIIGAGNRSCAT
jgi:Fe-S cluster assembly protein SufD